MQIDEPNFQKNKDQLLRVLRRSLQRANRSLQKCILDLKQCHEWEEVHHHAELLQANLYQIKKEMHSVIVSDWLKEGASVLILLKSLQEPHEQVASIFRKSKKLKKGIEPMTLQVARMEVECKRIAILIEKAEKTQSEKDLEPFLFKEAPKKKDKIKLLPTKRYKEYLTETGLSIWVGKSAKDNDLLTFSLAKGSDWWFHVNGIPGSHVILRVPKKGEPDEASIQDALQIALHHSKARDLSEAEICVTQCKFVVRSGKNRAGQVQISKQKNLRIWRDLTRLKLIQKRK